MASHFFHDYSPAIAVYMKHGWHRVSALDADGEVLIGARSAHSHADAYWRLCDFIDGELERRLDSR